MYLKLKTLCLLILFFTVNTYAQLESEPNNYFNTADAFTLTSSLNIQGAIDVNGDADYYAITVSQPGVLKIDINNVPAIVDMDVTLYNTAQNVVSNRDADNGANPSSIVYSICTPNTYYIRLFDDGNNESSADLYDLIITYNTTDTYECNNSFLTATPISLGQNVSGQIGSFGDADYYVVTVPSAGVFEIDVSFVPSNIDMDVVLYNTGQNVIINRDADNGSPVNINQLVCTAGTYYIRLWDDGNDEYNPNAYNLIVNFDTSDIYECNNQFIDASPIPLGQNISAQIRSVGDNDYYEITAPSAGVFEIDVTFVPSNIDMDVVLYDAGQNIIINQDADNGNPVHFDQFVCTAGTYYLRLRDDVNDESNPNLYNLLVNFDNSDPNECNYNFSTAASIDICDSTQGAINTVGNADYYTFLGVANETIQIQFSNIPGNIQPRLRIYDNLQTQLTVQTGTTGQTLTYDFTPTYSGQYYISLEENGNNASNAALYTLTLTSDACILPACTTKPQVTAETGDVYINNACYGTIMTAPNGDCFRVQVKDDGSLVTRPVVCPQ